MSASTPEQLYSLLADAFAAGDMERVMALYEPGAAIVPQPGTVMVGADQVRAALQGFLDVNVRFKPERIDVITADNVALVTARWSADIDGPDGKPATLAGVSTDILRRQPDGGWRYVIDQPWGDQATAS
jgi:uncharacterized protein (TIGR02246 family)